MLWRNITDALLEALRDRPVVLVNGPRQSGKTTLVRSLAEGVHPAAFRSLDEAPVLAAASADPPSFLAEIDGPVVLDEVQRVPDLFLAIKAEVDRLRRPGRFLLTGSADVLLLPKLADALPGRMEILTLWPFSQGELEGIREGFVDAVFVETLPHLPPVPARPGDLWDRIVRGGFPEVQELDIVKRREAWFGSYITTILQRDVREMAHIAGLTEMPRLLSLLATRAGGLLNAAELSSPSGLPWSTLKRYLALLEKTFLVQMVPAWSGNLGRRLVKAPKVLLADSGLIAFMLGVGAERLAADRTQFGGLVECFVAMELIKQATWSETRPTLWHLRAQGGKELDFVLEDRRGRLVGIEVKSSATVKADDFKWLRAFAEATGKRFWRGIVLYVGREAVPFGERLHALPIGALWRLGARKATGEPGPGRAPAAVREPRRKLRSLLRVAEPGCVLTRRTARTSPASRRKAPGGGISR
jgi:predicted AAA+ superfamily ATPase